MEARVDAHLRHGSDRRRVRLGVEARVLSVVLAQVHLDVLQVGSEGRREEVKEVVCGE